MAFILNKCVNLSSLPDNGSDNFRRRDFNLLPAIYDFGKSLVIGFVQFSGVFIDSEGAWIIPVTFKEGGQLDMKDITDPSAFKQGMNLYKSAGISLYSRKNRSMYNILFGGLNYQYYDNRALIADSKIPFFNQVMTIKMNASGDFTEHLMSSSIPTIPAPTAFGYLLFGTSSYFIAKNISA